MRSQIPGPPFLELLNQFLDEFAVRKGVVADDTDNQVSSIQAFGRQNKLLQYVIQRTSHTVNSMRPKEAVQNIVGAVIRSKGTDRQPTVSGAAG